MNKADKSDERIMVWGGEPGCEEAFQTLMLDIVNTFPFYIIIIDEDHNILLANEAVLKAVGMNNEDIIGGYCPKIIHCTDGPFSGCPLEDALEKNTFIQKDLLDPFYHNWVSSSIYPMNYRTTEGKRVFYHIAQDITARKNAEETLAKEHQFLEHVLESLTQPFYVINVEDYTISVSNAAAGFGKLNDHSKCYRLTHGSKTPCDTKDHPCPIKLIQETRKPVVLEHIHRHGDEERYYEVHGYPIFNDENEVTRIIEYTHDITERKKAESELAKIQTDLEQKSRTLEEHNITLKVLLNHQEEEKKTIYQNIYGSIKTMVVPYIDKMKNTGLNEEQQALLSILKSNIAEVFNPLSSYLMDDSLNLSPTEIRVAMMIREGKTAKEIANVLYISENTVKAHFRNIRSKLNIKNKKINLRSYLQSHLND